MKEKVILAYSGGLDTTAIIPCCLRMYRLRTGRRTRRP